MPETHDEAPPLSVGQTYAKTLREIAGMAQNPEVKRRIELLAIQFERTFERQADTMTVALMGMELGLNDQISQVERTVVALGQTVETQQAQIDKILELLIALEERYFRPGTTTSEGLGP